ncbi:MAG: amino acid synthesis family protein [Desulfobacterota bacterium]|nr:amino acid synthesis family protein [Thermodesulfobacteriota bacterium]MDW8002523.1 amino acid synthesis family protein [Deltaproteobacteria bacterium]
MEIRKIVTVIEEIYADGEKKVEKPIKKVAAIAVIKNPYAGKYEEDLTPLIDFSEEIGKILSQKAVSALSGEVESYGKACIVGEKGELEHAAALLHPKLGTPLREAVGGGKAIIPSAKKIGGMGASIDVPLHYKDAAFVRSHFDAMTVSIADAPKSDEIVLVICVTDGGRPHPRVGGLKKEEAKKEDGLR